MTAAILGALLDSIAPELQQVRCLDLTSNHAARGWFERKHLPLQLATSSQLGKLGAASYSLIVCEPVHLGLVELHLDPGGLLLVFAHHHDHQLLNLQLAGYANSGSVQDTEGTWHLLAPKRTATRPDFELSVLFTCRDQARATMHCVQSLAAETPPATWELIVVDRESWDGTPTLLRAVEGDAQVLRVAREHSECRALQYGFSHVRGSVCAVIDPRLTYSPEWLTHVIQAHRLKPRAIFLGQCALYSGPDRSLPIPPLAVPRDRLRELPLDDQWAAGPLFARWTQGRDDIFAIEEWQALLVEAAANDAA